MMKSHWVLGLLAGAVWMAAHAAASGEPADEGWVSMFNGKDLSGWVAEGTREYRDGDRTAPVWTAGEGRIVCAGKGFGFLRYDRPLQDFVFELEFRLAPRVNSGIGIRHGKYTGELQTRPSLAGYEIQLLDDAGKEPSPTSSGSLYRYVAPATSAMKPAGKWNRMTITCRGPQITIALNGQQLHDVDQRSETSIADKPLQGYVSLQNHGGKVEFRKLRVKELK